jgi:ribosomal protein L4
MVFNQKVPIFLAVAAVALGIRLWTIRNRKLIADENELVVSDKQKIAYDSIEKIDKTLFKEKGFFIITYKDEKGDEVNLKLSNRTYDNLAAVLDHLVAKIS